MSIIINDEKQLRNKEYIKKILTALDIDFKSTNNLSGGAIRVHTKGLSKDEPYKFTNFVKNKQYNNLFDFLLNDEDNKRTEEEIKDKIDISDELFKKLRFKNNFTKEDMEKFKLNNSLRNNIIKYFISVIDENFDNFTVPSEYLANRKLQNKKTIKEKTKFAFELNTDKIIDILKLVVTNIKDDAYITKEFNEYKKLNSDNKDMKLNTFILQVLSSINYSDDINLLKNATVERFKKFPICFRCSNHNDFALKLRVNEDNQDIKYSIIGKTIPLYNENDFKNKDNKNILISEGTSDFETIKIFMKENNLDSSDFINFGVHSAGYDFYKEIDTLLDKTNIIIMGDNDLAGKDFENKIKRFIRKQAILKRKPIPNITTAQDLEIFDENKEDINDIFNNDDKKDLFIDKINEKFSMNENIHTIGINRFLFAGDEPNLFIDTSKNYLFEDIEKYINDNNFGNNIPFFIGETFINDEKKLIYTKVSKLEFYKLIYAKNYDVTNFLLNENPIKINKKTIEQDITIDDLIEICSSTIKRIQDSINPKNKSFFEAKINYLKKEMKIYEDINNLEDTEYKNKVEKLISISKKVADIAKENNMEINTRGSGNALYSLYYLGVTSTNILENPFYDPQIFIKPGIKLPDVDLELNPASIKKIVAELNEDYNISLPLINKVIPKKINGVMTNTNGNTIHTSKYFSLEDVLNETNVDEKLKNDINKLKYLISKEGIDMKYIPIRYKELEDSVNIDLISYGLNEKRDNVIDRRKSKSNKLISMNDILDNTNQYKLKEQGWNELTHMTYGTKQIMKYIYDFETIQDKIQCYISNGEKYYNHSNLPHFIYQKDDKGNAINIKNILSINKDKIILDNDDIINIDSFGETTYLNKNSKEDLEKKQFNSVDMSSIISLNRPLFNQNVFEIDGEKYTNIKTDMEFFINDKKEVISNKALKSNHMTDDLRNITEDIVIIKSLNKDNVKVVYMKNDYMLSSRYKRNDEKTLNILNGVNTIYDDENKVLNNEVVVILKEYNSLEEVGEEIIENNSVKVNAKIEKRFLLKKFKENVNNKKLINLLPDYLKLTNGVLLYQDTLEAVINEISFSEDFIKYSDKSEEQLKALLLKYTTKPSKVKDKDRELTYKIISEIFNDKIYFKNLNNVEEFKKLILPQLEVVIQSQPYFFKFPHAINLAEFYIINEVEKREILLKQFNEFKIIGLTKWKNGEGRYLNYFDGNSEKQSLIIKNPKMIEKIESLNFNDDNKEFLKNVITKVNNENKKEIIKQTTTNTKSGNLKNYNVTNITLVKPDFAFLNVENEKKKLSISISDKNIIQNIMNDLNKIGLPKPSENKNKKSNSVSYYFKEKNINFENIHYKTYNDKLYLEGYTKIFKINKSFDPTFP